MKTNLRKQIKNEQGSASILIMILAAAFIAVSASIITVSANNLHSSQELIDANFYYYQLDTQGENYLADVDSKLSIAEQEAVNYILNRDFEKYAHKELPLALQNQIKDMVAQATDLNFTYNEAMNIVYLYYCDMELNNLKEKYETSIVSSLKNEDEVLAIIAEINLNNPEKTDMHLNVVINVNKLDYEFGTENGEITAKRLSNGRFSINSWSQW